MAPWLASRSGSKGRSTGLELNRRLVRRATGRIVDHLATTDAVHSDFLIERALARRARSRSNERGSATAANVSNPRAPPKPQTVSDDAPLPGDQVLAQMRMRSLDRGGDFKPRREIIVWTPPACNASKSMENVESQSERVRSKLDRIMGRIRADAVDLRDRLEEMWSDQGTQVQKLADQTFAKFDTCPGDSDTGSSSEEKAWVSLSGLFESNIPMIHNPLFEPA